MISLKQLAMYCRDYIDLVSPSLLSRQAKQILIPSDILDANSLYTQNAEIDYEHHILKLNLEPLLDQLESNEEYDSDISEFDDDLSEELNEKEKEKIKIAKALDDIYRKYETSSYTKQVYLKFGRIEFLGKPLKNDNDELLTDIGYKKAEQHLFSVPISINYNDSNGARHYSISIDDSLVTTEISFLKEYLPQKDRDELFRFISEKESAQITSIPLALDYIDELWTKISHYLIHSDGKDISDTPDLGNVLIILLPKVNYFLSQDLLGIIDASDDEKMMETSLSAWVDDREMTSNDKTNDNGSQELFFPFPYDNSQLQVLGRLNNRAAVVEGPPGTGKSQTIANILCHLAATGKKVLFVSQKDQAIRGVKDKLKTLEIPYLFGYLPDRSSRLHSEDDEKDSAAYALKGITQSRYNVIKNNDPKEILIKLNEYKPEFNSSLDSERIFYEKYQEWDKLDKYDFGIESKKISNEWYENILELQSKINNEKEKKSKLDNKIESKKDKISELKNDIDKLMNKIESITNDFHKNNKYDWVDNENDFLRKLKYKDLSEMLDQLLEKFDSYASDRKNNFIKKTFNNIKLKNQLNIILDLLPQEMYESIKNIVFDDNSKTKRYIKLKNIYDYFKNKTDLTEKKNELNTEILKIVDELNKYKDEFLKNSENLKNLSDNQSKMELDSISMKRIHSLFSNESKDLFVLIKKRYDLKIWLNEYKILNPNEVNAQIITEKKKYKSLIRNYIKNNLSLKINKFSESKKYRAALESIGRKLSKSKRAYKTLDSLKSNPFNFDAMSSIIPIWMMGLDDASRVLPLVQNIFDYVIIDEASQCNISYSLPVMYRSKHTILFGDTLQMRDSTTAFKSNELLTALANKHNIPEDLQIKATEDSVKSVMDIAKLSGFQTTVLRKHYRSPKELIGFSNEWFYEPRGKKLQIVNDDILAMEDGRVLKNYVIAPNENIELSEKTNLSEAYFIKDKLIPKIKSNPLTSDKTIAVLTFFNEQAELLRRVITDENIKISVIEGIQGDERDIIIYSFVIKSPQEKRRYTSLTGEGGEIKKEINEGRVNVAFSRAKLQVHAVTSLAPNLWPEGIWIKRYLEYIEKSGRVQRLKRSEQHFDSKFEQNVYDYLFSELDTNQYSLTTQVESCGFKIDLVIRNNMTGEKLAIECDGPTHFEHGDGQVRVKNDYERQFVLETAGWRFYRIIYSDWIKNELHEKEELKNYIAKFMDQSVSVIEKDNITNEPVYVPISVDIPDKVVEDLKTSILNSKKNAFGKKTISISKDNSDLNNNLEINKIRIDREITKKTQANKNVQLEINFSEIFNLKLSKRRSFVGSWKDEKSIWINEKINSENYKGFTSKGFGFDIDKVNIVIDAIKKAIESENFSYDMPIDDKLKLVIRSIESDTVDIRYFKTSKKYTGYIKKGLRMVNESANKLNEELIKISNETN